ncbi:MAG TPA: CvpA family protein [Gammaproteobacteria bacterium]|nr:CvpA family protein [Gammaproteobacteria bacterium]
MWLDIVILLVVAVSTVFGVIRGFARNMISLASWILAFVIALSLSEKFAQLLPDDIEQPGLRIGIAMCILFLVTLIMGMLATFLLEGFVNAARINRLDRSLGGLFGFARGVLFVCLLVVLGAFISLNQTDWWQESKLIPAGEWVVQLLEPVLPDSVTGLVKL